MRKKILVIHESLRVGGAEKVLVDILRRFDYEKYDITLFLWNNDGSYLSQIPFEVKVVSHKSGKSSFWERLHHHLPESLRKIAYKKSISWVKERQFDTIISFMEGIPALIHSFIYSLAPNNISWIHSDMENNRWSEAYFPYNKSKEFYNKMNKIVFVSEGAKTKFNNIFSLQANSIVIRNIQDPDIVIEKSHELCPKNNSFTVCSVGRVILEKRFDRVIETAFYVKKKGYDIHFQIIGDGPLKKDLEKMSKQLAVSDRISFLGYQNNPYKYMARADLFMLTSQSEGYALVVGEALCLGKPVVSTIVTGPDELLKNSVGILCDGTPEALGNAIIELYNDKTLRETYSAKAIYKSKEFDPKRTMEAIYTIL